MLTLAGKQLKGIEATTTNFAFAERYKLLKLEVNPEKPYSVILRCTVLDGELYVDAAAMPAAMPAVMPAAIDEAAPE